MKQALKESLEKDAGSYKQMKSAAHAYSSKRECSLQETVYQVMPELWLKKVFPGVLYANSNIPEKRVKMMLSKKEISQLPKDCTDTYKRNMVNRYMIRLKDSIFEHLFYALFIKRYQLQPKPSENDSQPGVLDDKLFEANHSTTNSYPDALILSSGEILHYRKGELVLWYHVYNRGPRGLCSSFTFYILSVS